MFKRICSVEKMQKYNGSIKNYDRVSYIMYYIKNNL